MTMIRLTFLAGLVAAVSPANAATLVQYNFLGQPGNQASTAASGVASGLAGLAFTRGSGLNAVSGADSINASGFTNANAFYNFGLTVTSGFSAVVNELVIGTRSSNTGPGFINLLASVDGGAFATIASFAQTGTAENNQTISFRALTALTGITFRLTPSGTTAANGGTLAAGGTFRVQNLAGGSGAPVSINGNVTRLGAAVPEPASWAMMIAGFGLAGLALRRRRVAVRIATAG